jgi:hypothetical protein
MKIEEDKFIVDIVLSLTINELKSLRQLADLNKKTLPEIARECMNQKCKELLADNT